MTAKIKLTAGSGGGTVSWVAPTSTTSNADVEFKLPVADGTAGQVLSTDGSGNLSWTSVSGTPITVVNTWRISSTEKHEGTNAVITSDWEEIDTDSYGKVGSSLTNSSGIFSFPATGMYYIVSNWRFLIGTAADGAANVSLDVTTDGTNFDEATIITVGDGGGSFTQHASGDFVFDVTSTSTHKFRWRTHSMSGNSRLLGSSTTNSSYFTAIRIGDT